MNPFAITAWDVCGDVMPPIPTGQDCTNHAQPLSQICGVVLLPDGGNRPGDWTTQAGWDGCVKNDDLTGNKGRYLVGMGSFLPSVQNRATLSGGRYQKTLEKTYSLDFQVVRTDAQTRAFWRMIESGKVFYDVWLETLGGRLIGGSNGIRASLVDGSYPFDGGEKSRERLELKMEFTFWAFPEVTDNFINILQQSHFWGDPSANAGNGEIWGNGTDGWGWQN